MPAKGGCSEIACVYVWYLTSGRQDITHRENYAFALVCRGGPRAALNPLSTSPPSLFPAKDCHTVPLSLCVAMLAWLVQS